MIRIAKTLILSTVFALALAVPANAHHVDAAASSADCTKVIAKYVGFNDNDKPITEKITVDGNVVYGPKSYTWDNGQANNTHTIAYPNALTPGNHTVTFTATWSTQGSNNGTFTKQVSCASPSRVNAAASSADCTKVTAKYESFGDADKPVTEKITVDGNVVYGPKSYTWSGSSNNPHTIAYPNALTPGNHTVTFTATWSTQGSNTNAFTVNVYCQSPPQTPPSYGCDGKVVDKDHPPATCPGPPVQVSVPTSAPPTTVTQQNTICLSRGTLVLYTRHSKILRERVYVDGRLVANTRPNANSHRDRFALPASTGPIYTIRIVAKLRSDRTGRVFRWTKTVTAKRCGIAPARARHIDP